MGMIFSGIVVAVVIAIGAGYLMNAQQEPSWQFFSTSSVRVGDPGSNLVGQDWSGQPEGGSAATVENAEKSS